MSDLRYTSWSIVWGTKNSIFIFRIKFVYFYKRTKNLVHEFKLCHQYTKACKDEQGPYIHCTTSRVNVALHMYKWSSHTAKIIRIKHTQTHINMHFIYCNAKLFALDKFIPSKERKTQLEYGTNDIFRTAFYFMAKKKVAILSHIENRL